MKVKIKWNTPLGGAAIAVIANFVIGTYGYVTGRDNFMYVGFGLLVISVMYLSIEMLLRKGLREGMTFNGTTITRVDKMLRYGGYALTMQKIDSYGIVIYDALWVGGRIPKFHKRKGWVAYNVYTKMLRDVDGKIHTFEKQKKISATSKEDVKK